MRMAAQLAGVHHPHPSYRLGNVEDDEARTQSLETMKRALVKIKARRNVQALLKQVQSAEANENAVGAADAEMSARDSLASDETSIRSTGSPEFGGVYSAVHHSTIYTGSYIYGVV